MKKTKEYRNFQDYCAFFFFYGKQWSFFMLFFFMLFFFMGIFFMPIKEASATQKKPYSETLVSSHVNEWQYLGEGLAYQRMQIMREEATKKNTIEVLRFDPELFEISLYSAMLEDKTLKSTTAWLEKHSLIAGINAAMFLPDGLTSNGYMRKDLQYNNKHIGAKLGAFFLSKPRYDFALTEQTKNIIDSTPKTAILYKNDKNLQRFIPLVAANLHKSPIEVEKIITWEIVLDHYQDVVQNFQLFDSAVFSLEERKSLFHSKTWASPRKHSITALGEDMDGHILFLFAYEPMTINSFINALLKQENLNIVRALYTEGGSQSSMSFYHADTCHEWSGYAPYFPFFVSQTPIPNIIGVTVSKK